MQTQRIKDEAFVILFESNTRTFVGALVNYSIFTLIILNILAVMFETIDSFAAAYQQQLYAFEVFSVACFTIEYIFRLWVSTSHPKYCLPVSGRMRYSLSFFALIDLLAILPFYLPMLIPIDLRFVRVLRMLRLLRILKIGRYFESLNVITAVLKEKKEELTITAVFGSILLVFSSSMMYYFEHTAQPEAFPSIPGTLWWGVVTLTTVGYGDVFPITPAGRVFGALIAFIGIGLFALPTGILGAGFVEVIGKKNKLSTRCPHCGKEITD